MGIDPKLLQEILDDDDLGLLDAPAPAAPDTPRDRCQRIFEDINRFIDRNRREPSESASDGTELNLYYQLRQLKKANASLRSLLDSLDRHRLLPQTPEGDVSIETVGGEEPELFDRSDIFDLRNISGKSIQTPDYIGRARPCADFETFRPLFDQCKADLQSKKMKRVPFQTVKSIRKGAFFVLRGVIHYIADVGPKKQGNDRLQARLRCILDNGKETDILNWTFAKNLYKDGEIIKLDDGSQLDKLGGIDENDQKTGIVYVLKSLSREENVRCYKDLHKIGVTTTTVADRTRGCETDPTYLMAGVRCVKDFNIYNADAQKMEKLLHHFFDSARVAIDVFDIHGDRHQVREWFQVPLEVITEAVDRAVCGTLADYYYDRNTRSIVHR